MRWRDGRRSDNVEDQRSGGGFSSGGGGGIPLLPMILRLAGRKGGIGTLLLMAAVVYFTGGDLGSMLGGLTGEQAGSVPSSRQAVQQSAEEKQLSEFVSVVLADTEDAWHTLFKKMGKTYQEPKLVLFKGAVRSACGMGQAAMGPFYCPGDKKVYIDLSFYSDLKKRHNAPGDFAQAYVIAHEVGHHVQTLLGISQKVHSAKQRASEVEGNRLSVRQELQADCFAGVWAYHAHKARNILERGDVDEALNAASAIGDDRLQKQGRGYVTPDSFTHGSSAQRVKWFKRGIESGDLNSCDTFSVSSL
jgi:hypothetical protein